MPESKYYDKYTSNDVNTACNGSSCLSHSLSETLGWYNDSYLMVSEIYPWSVRSGSYGSRLTGSGIFNFNNNLVSGEAVTFGSFRLVMSSSL